jgi:hypothetical protein
MFCIHGCWKLVGYRFETGLISVGNWLDSRPKLVWFTLEIGRIHVGNWSDLSWILVRFRRWIDVGIRRLTNFHIQPKSDVYPTSGSDVYTTSTQRHLFAGINYAHFDHSAGNDLQTQLLIFVTNWYANRQASHS